MTTTNAASQAVSKTGSSQAAQTTATASHVEKQRRIWRAWKWLARRFHVLKKAKLPAHIAGKLDSESLAQTGFSKLPQAVIKEIERDVPVTNYLDTLAENEIIDILRRETRRGGQVPLLDTAEPAVAGVDPGTLSEVARGLKGLARQIAEGPFVEHMSSLRHVPFNDRSDMVKAVMLRGAGLNKTDIAQKIPSSLTPGSRRKRVTRLLEHFDIIVATCGLTDHPKKEK